MQFFSRCGVFMLHDTTAKASNTICFKQSGISPV